MLSIKNLTFTALDDGPAKEILSDVSFTAEDGKFIVITGPNGSGKSTLAKIIAGIKTQTDGEIFLDEDEITHASITERAQKGIAFAFQQPVRFKGLTVTDLIGLAAGKEIGKDELCEILTRVGLCALEYIDRDVNDSLSGGEIKRIEIAMAMVRNAKLTIFDEPEAGIDLWSFNHLIDIFKDLRDNTNGSIIIISHQERILDIADKIIVLSAGKIVAEGTKEEVLPTLISTNSQRNFCRATLSDLEGVVKINE